MSKNFKKLEQNCKLIYIIAFLASGCSSVGSHGGGGGGGAPGAAGGAPLECGGNSAVGGNSGGGQQWGCLQPLRTALHTISISISLQKSLN